MSKKLIYIIFFIFSIYILSISFTPAKNTMEAKMTVKINQKCDFSQVDVDDSSGSTECSPVITEKQIMDGMTGIFINMPEKIALKDSKLIKVCLLSILEGNFTEKHGGSELLVLKMDSTNKVINGNFLDDDIEAPPPVTENKVENDNFLVGSIEEDYFNFNLNSYLNFDKKPGIYHFYITMGPMSSNVVTFEIVPDK